MGGAKQRALLAILLLDANAVVSSDRLMDDLWGAEPPKTAAKSLQVLISQLRKVLEPDRASGESGRLLVTRPPGYLIRVEPNQLDLERFRHLAAEGREALAAGDPVRAATTLREALALWRGPPFADLAYTDFAQRESSRLEELRLAALEDRMQADLETGRHGEIIGEVEKHVSEYPLRERPRAQLMLALYRSGRQADALDAYREARRTLVDELGIEPGRGLKELHSAILEQDPALDLDRSTPERRQDRVEEQRPSGTRSDSFVGRERELAEFWAAIDDCQAGRMSVFTIAGEPGIGKSRLADELTSLAQARGVKVCWGRCWEAGGAPPYWPWVQALRAYIRESEEERIRKQLAPGAPDIAQILPELHDLFPDLPAPASHDPEGARFRLFDSTATFLRAAGEVQPLVLVLDDLHAADKPSLLLLRFLAHSLRDARLIVVATYRETETDTTDSLAEAVSEVRREPVTRTIRLGGLDVSEVARVIELIGGTRPGDELATTIHHQSEGNPLFVGELVRLLASEGRLEEVASSPWKPNIPQGIREVIGHRLRHLSTECKQVLSVASVVGREFRPATLAGVSERPDAELLDLLDEARRARVVTDSPTGRDRLRFSHALIRESLYGELATTERRRFHRRAVEVLEQLYGSDLEPHLAELAHHSLEASPGGDVDKAIQYARGAGDQAAGLLAYEEAARLYQMALDATELKAPPDEATRCELLLELGDAQAKGGDLISAKETFVGAADAARRLDAPTQLGRAALGYGGRYVWFRAGSDQRLIPLLEDALAKTPDTDSALRARLLARLAGALRDRPALERRAALSREAVEMARRLGDRSTLAYALDGTYAALSWPRDAEAWLAMARELTELAEETGDKEQAFSSHLHAFGAFMVRGDTRAAGAEFGRMAALAQELRQPAHAWSLSIARGTRALFAGRIAEADRLIQQFAELGPGGQGSDATDFYYVLNLQTWAVRREQGRVAEVESSLESVVQEYPTLSIFRWLLTSLYSELGRERETRTELDRLAADEFADLHVGTEWFFGAGLLAEVCDRLRDERRAEPLYEALLPYADCNVFAHPEASLGSAWRPLGLLAAIMSRWDEAESHFERALDMNARMGTPLWVAHSQHDYGRVLIRRGARGDVTRASELLLAACRGYEELGMTSWQTKASADRAGLG